jgi:hypothetical protein
MADPALLGPVDLATIKDDLGIPADNTSSDAWLARRIDGIWSRMQAYTGRPLLLASTWTDDWGRLITNHPAPVEPPLIAAWPSASVFLRVFPVKSIAKVTFNGEQLDVSRVLFEQGSGKLIGLDGWPRDVRHALIGGRVAIDYEAGFAELPPVLYEVLLGALTVQWTARQAAASGVAPGGFLPTRINATDVGEIDLSPAANFFVDQSGRRGATDPLLGPFAMLLDEFVDWRTMLGGAYPATTPVEAAPP